MMVWVVLVCFWLLVGAIAGVVENYMRDESIPSWHIIGVGLTGAVLGGLVTVIAAGTSAPRALSTSLYVSLLLAWAFLMVDRLISRANRGL